MGGGEEEQCEVKKYLTIHLGIEEKRYPDGSIRKYKARFCVRGDKQVYGVDFDETYALSVQWSMVRMLFTFALTLGLNNCQVDYSNAFVQANIDKVVYCDLPLEFCGPSSDDYVLEKKKSSVQSPPNLEIKKKLPGND